MLQRGEDSDVRTLHVSASHVRELQSSNRKAQIKWPTVNAPQREEERVCDCSTAGNASSDSAVVLQYYTAGNIRYR